MLKYKPTKIDYYHIYDVKEAISKDGEAKGMLGSFEVISKHGKFSVGAGKLTHDERADLWVNRADVRGKVLKVKHEHITTGGGIPISCIALAVVNCIGE